MRRDVPSGVLLIVGSLLGVFALAHHPTAHDVLGGGGSGGAMRLNVIIHAVAIAGVPMLFTGLLGLVRRLQWTELAVTALVLYGFGAVAVLGAGVASGFVASDVMERILDGDDAAHALLGYTFAWNQGLAKVNVVATAVAIVLVAVSILRTGRLSRAAGWAGTVVGAGVLLGFFSGHVRLDVHGFGLITFAQSAWTVWLGVLLCLRSSV